MNRVEWVAYMQAAIQRYEHRHGEDWQGLESFSKMTLPQ
jgi:hypothetical protein